MLKKWMMAALAAASWSCGSPGHANAPAAGAVAAAPPAVPVRVAVSQSRRVPVEVATVGNVEAWSTVQVRAVVGGTLIRVHFAEGQLVNAGDVLFEIFKQPYEEAIRQWEANKARDEGQLKLAEANLARAEAQSAHYGRQAERYAKLAEQGIFSKEHAEQAEVEARARRTGVRAETANVESVKAAIRADEAALSNARLNLSYCTIKSPITGRTGALKVNEGNLIKANDTELVTIHQIQPVYVSFSVPEEHLNVIRARGGRLPVTATVPGEAGRSAATGSVTFLDNSVDASTGTIRMKAQFGNENSRFWPGQFVDVKLRLEDRPDAVVVPAQAVQTGQQGNFVYVVKADSTVDMRPVATGPRVETHTSLLRGLHSGETVVTEGQLRLAPGMKVKVMP